ncbi:stalk domain-containing protein [Paenibacillus sp. FSL H8-0034]|uniref:stalk domain-containing protein n=1 Tax=Paenibacillus sp. FSL H8-0034 TaxID=2954671 RepID=UPI0030F9A835
MKKLWGKQAAAAAIIVLMLGWIAPDPTAAASGSLPLQSTVVQANGKSFTIQWTTIDLSDPHLRVMPVTAAEGIGHVESFAAMIDHSGAVVAINGTFFDAYEQDESLRHPNGLLVESGSFVRSGDNVSLGIRTDKSALIHRLETALTFKVKHNKSVYTVSPWGTNTYYGDEDLDQVVAYTRHFAERIDRTGGMKVIIENGRITKMTEQAADVPEQGYVIFVGHSSNNDSNLLPHLHEGDEVEVEALIVDGNSGVTESLPQSWDTAMGVGPKLVTDGQVDIDYARDGFDDPRITSTANTRSFVGVDGNGHLVMGTLSAATVADMAQALVQLGLREAMNMDGGASSGLYVEGAMKRTPGRLLSNALIVKRYEDPQVQVAVNGSFVNEFRGFIKEDVTMVPFRGIFERIGADFHWNEQERVLTSKRGSIELVLRPDVPEATVNGKSIQLDQAPTIVDGHIYIPLRFVGETLGAKVGWDQGLYRATLDLK